jgi:hypothetical protein
VTARAEKDESRPGTWRLVVTVPADAPVGKIDDAVILTTEVPGETEIEVGIEGEVLPSGK